MGDAININYNFSSDFVVILRFHCCSVKKRKGKKLAEDSNLCWLLIPTDVYSKWAFLLNLSAKHV